MRDNEKPATVELGSLIEASAAAVQRAFNIQGSRLPFPIVCGLILDPRWPPGLPGGGTDGPEGDPFGNGGILRLANAAAQAHREYVQKGVAEFKKLNRPQRTAKRLENLKAQRLINDDDLDWLRKIIEQIYSHNSIPSILREVQSFHKQLLHGRKPSPLAVVISSIIEESVTWAAGEFEAGRQSEAMARGVFSSDSEGVVEGGGLGAIAGAEGGTVVLPGIGTVGGTLGGAIVGGIAGGAIRSLGSILDAIFD